jgi:CBS domain-containing protein
MSDADSLYIRDIMQTDVTTVAPETRVRDLTRILADQGISGAPVVTPSGSVAGVVSSTDVVRLAAEESQLRVSSTRWIPVADPGAWDEASPGHHDTEDLYASYFLPEDMPAMTPEWGQQLEGGPFDELTVAEIMTPVSFTLPPTTSVKELADFLIRGRIHRAVVVEGERLVGIVTTMDVLRALAEDRI